MTDSHEQRVRDMDEAREIVAHAMSPQDSAFDAQCRRIARAKADAREEGRQQERADVVATVDRETSAVAGIALYHPTERRLVIAALGTLRAFIERGGHVGAAGGSQMNKPLPTEQEPDDWEPGDRFPNFTLARPAAGGGSSGV